MFSFLLLLDAPIGGKFYLYNTNDIFMKSIGITKLATLAYGISPSAVQTDVSTLQAGEALGIKGCYTNNSVQFGHPYSPRKPWPSPAAIAMGPSLRWWILPMSHSPPPSSRVECRPSSFLRPVTIRPSSTTLLR